MKTKAIFAALTMLALLAGSAYAPDVNAEWGHVDRVDGTVTDYDGTGINVTFGATCAGAPVDIYHYTLNDPGNYRVYFDCDAGQEACVTATAAAAGDGRFVVGCGTMYQEGAHNKAVIDLVFDETDPIPEFGLLAIPFLLSMAGFVFMRGKM
ncbi:MAG: hypothetical protein U9Q92_00100 [archaeon]|nr:hypothetical protein [archaeon]